MFTVVIAEKEHISSIQNYGIFLKPYMTENIALCEWIREGSSIAECVPTLENTVSHRAEWRAIILCDEEGLHRRNPFDLVAFAPPERPKYEEQMAEYLNALRAAKCSAYDEAAKKPLVRLLTGLCEAPLTISGSNSYARENPEFSEYQYEVTYKNQLRKEILAGEKLKVFYPSEVVCIAKRTNDEPAHDIESAWMQHDIHQYRRFYDWNMYFDKMRYLVYDILPHTHRQYDADYLKFLAVVLLLAGNDIPADALHPNMVYHLQGDSEHDVLQRLLLNYDKKLCSTNMLLEEHVKKIINKAPHRLNDAELNDLLSSGTTIPVSIENSPDLDDLYAETDDFGLATDVPLDERQIWAKEHKASEKAVGKMLRQAPRGLKRAGETLRQLSDRTDMACPKLTAFQMEDVEDSIHNEEMAMARLFSENGYHPEEYSKELKQAAEKVSRKIDTRITKRQIVIVGIVALVLTFLGFLPLFIGGFRNSDSDQIFTALLMFLCAATLLAIVGIICLLYLRSALKKTVGEYNSAVKGIADRLHMAQQQFSTYLTHMCSAMRGFNVLNYLADHEPADTKQVRIYRKHQADITLQRRQLRELFGEYLPSGLDVPCQDTAPYEYDFDRAIDYCYLIPPENGQAERIEFMEKGHKIPANSTFIQSVHVKLEEYYD